MASEWADLQEKVAREVVDGGGGGEAAPAPDLLALARAALATWVPRLHLGHWQIELRLEEPGKGIEGMSVSTEWRGLKARICIAPDYLAVVERHLFTGDAPAAIVEEGVVHELLHLIEEPLRSQLDTEIVWAFGDKRDDTPGMVGFSGRTLWTDYREMWVNQVCRILISADRSGGWRTEA